MTPTRRAALVRRCELQQYLEDRDQKQKQKHPPEAFRQSLIANSRFVEEASWPNQFGNKDR